MDDDAKKQIKLDALVKARARAKEVREERSLLKKQEKELVKLEQKKKDDEIRKRYAELTKDDEPPKVETPKVETPKVETPKVESMSDDSSSDDQEVIIKKKKKKKKKSNKKVKYVYESHTDTSSEDDEPPPRPVLKHKPASRVPPSSTPMGSGMYSQPAPKKPSIKESSMYKNMFGIK